MTNRAEGVAVAALVEDLTAKLAGLAEDFGRRAAELSAPSERVDEADGALVATAKTLVAQRRARAQHLPGELFHEPAWDMLLALFIGDSERRTMNVKTLVSYSDAPATTSQRWIDHLHKLGLIERITDMVDRRRVEIQLSEAGHRAIRDYLVAIR